MEKLEELYAGGYIINTVSNRDLALKHLVHQLYEHASEMPKELGEAVDEKYGRKSPAMLWDQLTQSLDGRIHVDTEGGRKKDFPVNIGTDTRSILGIVPVPRQVNVKVSDYHVMALYGRKMDTSFMVDEFNNIYLPSGFRGEPMREIALAALEAAATENPKFYHGGVVNRLPAKIEKEINPAHFALLRLRRERLQKPPGATTLRRDSLLPAIPHIPSQAGGFPSVPAPSKGGTEVSGP